MKLFRRAVALIINRCGSEENRKESSEVTTLLVERMRIGGAEGEQANQLLKELWKLQSNSLVG